MNEKQESKTNPGVSVDVRVGQSLMIGNSKVTVEKKAGQLARLRVVAEEGIVVLRPPLGIVARAT